jgi:hypothetical protein
VNLVVVSPKPVTGDSAAAAHVSVSSMIVPHVEVLKVLNLLNPRCLPLSQRDADLRLLSTLLN